MEASNKASAKSKKKAQEELIDTTSVDQDFVDKMKKRATVKTYGIDNVTLTLNLTLQHATFEHPASFQGLTGRPDKSSIKDFIEQCDIDILKMDDEEIVFDLVGVEPPLANALRRILLAEIPTMAIEKVTMW